MKVAPSQIEFTLPSPKLGIESLPVIDPPWVPKFKTKINTIRDTGQVRMLYMKLSYKITIFIILLLYYSENAFEHFNDLFYTYSSKDETCTII